MFYKSLLNLYIKCIVFKLLKSLVFLQLPPWGTFNIFFLIRKDVSENYDFGKVPFENMFVEKLPFSTHHSMHVPLLQIGNKTGMIFSLLQKVYNSKFKLI